MRLVKLRSAENHGRESSIYRRACKIVIVSFFPTAKDAELCTFPEESALDLIIITGNKT